MIYLSVHISMKVMFDIYILLFGNRIESYVQLNVYLKILSFEIIRFI